MEALSLFFGNILDSRICSRQFITAHDLSYLAIECGLTNSGMRDLSKILSFSLRLLDVRGNARFF